MSRLAKVSVAALLALTVSTGYAAISPLRAESDRVITQEICAALAADPIYYFRHVDVDVRDGVATLSGYVWEPQDLYRARELTARVPGVTRVVNQMEINRFGEL